jgi:hypothetical protein
MRSPHTRQLIILKTSYKRQIKKDNMWQKKPKHRLEIARDLSAQFKPIINSLAASNGKAVREDKIETFFSPSIEFRQETIYFILVDRFYEGDPTKQEALNPEYYDPTRQHWCKYWGGDLQGIIDKLDYFAGMGVTALWISPLFEQVEGMWCDMTALHGYLL